MSVIVESRRGASVQPPVVEQSTVVTQQASVPLADAQQAFDLFASGRTGKVLFTWD